ncbi:MAG: hypothetical protein ACYCS7_09125 [Acidimicrobiales bacterium]
MKKRARVDPSDGEKWWALLRRLTPARLGGRLGLAVVGLGLLVIGLGWNGAAGSGGEIGHTPVVAAQLPWLLSGGFLGLGLVVLGAALVVAHSHREDRTRLEARLDELIGVLAGLQPGPAVAGAPADLRGLVVAGTASYHAPDCRMVVGRTDAALLTPEEAVARGLTACRVCRATAVSAGH